METISVIILVVLVGVVVLLLWLIGSVFGHRREISSQASGISLLQQQLESLKSSQDKTSEVLQKSLQAGQENLYKSLQSNQKVVLELNNQIGQLQGTNKRMLAVGEEVRRLQGILSSPKLRGQMGEWSLENVLSNILPEDSFELQYSFRDGRTVDALVQMSGYSVPIDAKFPLSSFEKMAGCQDDNEKARIRRQFVRDVRVHIDKIAESYIRPAEGTLDFAFVYIPAENVYYETVVNRGGEELDLLGYALERKVIPVSPNLLWVYLTTVVMGLHGLQIEKQAAEILRNLKKLNSFFADFGGSWDVLGRHLRNAYSQYEEGQKKLHLFGLELTHIQSDGEEEMNKAVDKE